MNYQYYDSPIGILTLVEENNQLIDLSFGNLPMPDQANLTETPLLKRTISQLEEYFAGRRQVFDLPLAPKGTPFMRAVWQALCTIPYGETASYQDIAIKVGSPKACRAVGMANNRNPIAIIIPCHRIIGKNGSLVGYGGGLPIKEKLLALEGKNLL